MAKSLALVVNKIDHIKIIDHKFHESGHTRTEYDSMHAAIEVVKKWQGETNPSMLRYYDT